MKKVIRLTEGDLRRVISKSVKRVLREADNDYEGNDLDYDSIKMQAMSIIPRMHQNGQIVSWRSVAKEMGFRLETLNGEDMELLKDAIEETMMEDAYDIGLTESDIHRIVKESVNRIINESLPSIVASKEDAIDYINGIFDICEELQEMGFSKSWSVRNIYPYENVYRNYYSNWVDATRHNYPRKRQLILDLLCDHMVYRRLDFQEIESIFNNRYGK